MIIYVDVYGNEKKKYKKVNKLKKVGRMLQQ